MASRRLRRVAIAPQLFVDAMMHGLPAIQVIANPLPVDTVYLHASVDLDSDTVWLFVSSREFEVLAEGAVIPVHPNPVFTRRELKAVTHEH